MDDATRLKNLSSLLNDGIPIQLELLTKLTEDLSLELDPDKMATQALRTATNMIGVDAGSIALITEDGEHLSYRWHVWPGNENSIAGMQRPFRINHGIAGKALRSRETEIIEDYPNFP